MPIRKTKSVPTFLHNFCFNHTSSLHSYHDFNNLLLKGEQRLLTFGEYSCTKHPSKQTKQKIIAYFYRKVKSKL